MYPPIHNTRLSNSKPKRSQRNHMFNSYYNHENSIVENEMSKENQYNHNDNDDDESYGSMDSYDRLLMLN